MKRSTAIAIVVAAMLLMVAGVVAAWVLWGLTGIRAIGFCYMLIGTPLFLWVAHKGRMRWEVIVLGFGFLAFTASIAISWLARGGAAGQVVSIVLTFTAAPCIWVGAIGMWRRLRAEKRTKSQHPETTQGA